MTEKTGQGQADKKDAEERTAQVGAESQATRRQQDAERQRAQEPKTAAEKVEQADSDDINAIVNPYPEYGEQSLEELRSMAEGRDVEINRDVEKAHLVHALRQADPTPAYDLMSLEDVRTRASEKGIGLEREFETAQLVSELRAADTHTR